jgi:hypothetical protein
VIYGSVREPLILQNLKSFFPCFASDVSREMRHSESCPPFEGAAASVIQALVPKQIKSRDVKCAPAPECHSRSARSGTRQFFIFNSSALGLITSRHKKIKLQLYNLGFFFFFFWRIRFQRGKKIECSRCVRGGIGELCNLLNVDAERAACRWNQGDNKMTLKT